MMVGRGVCFRTALGKSLGGFLFVLFITPIQINVGTFEDVNNDDYPVVNNQLIVIILL